MLKSNKEYVILVDGNDKFIGTEEKIKAHKKGKMHRAFSIFIFNSKGELLIQKRAGTKYHSGGLWSNTTCSHPKPEQSLTKSAHRRLKKEMGFDCPLEKAFKFHYQIVLDNDLIENEIDTVFIGKYDGDVKLNENEASDYKWISIERLNEEFIFNNNKYTAWLKIALKKYLEMKKQKNI